MPATTPLPESLWGKYRGTLRGFFLGLLIFALSFPLLLWNESSTILNVVDARIDDVVSLPNTVVQPNMDGRLVHLSGDLSPVSTVVDPQFGISLAVVKLQRQVETYQWIETRAEQGGNPTYAKAWLDELVDSSTFLKPEQHRNPAKLRFEDWESSTAPGRLGVFDVPYDLLDRFNPFQPVELNPDHLKTLSEEYRKESRLHEGLLYFSKTPGKPQVGETRLRYVAVQGGPVSLIGRQSGSTFGPYYTQSGYRVYRLRPGTHAATAMYAEAAPAGLLSFSTFLTWTIRLFAWGMMALGMTIMLERAGPTAETLPVLRDLLAPGPILFVVAISSSLMLLTVAFAWMNYSWLRAGLLATLALAVFIFLHRHGRQLREPAG